MRRAQESSVPCPAAVESAMDSDWNMCPAIRLQAEAEDEEQAEAEEEEQAEAKEEVQAEESSVPRPAAVESAAAAVHQAAAAVHQAAAESEGDGGGLS